MIVPMKKVTLLMSEKHRDAALTRLRKLGVMHVHNVQVPASEDVQSLENEMENVDRALLLLAETDKKGEKMALEKIPFYVEEILVTSQQRASLVQELTELEETHQWFDKWGAISYMSLQKLKKAGVYVRFYTGDKNAFKSIPADKTIHVCKMDNNTFLIALFARSMDEKFDLKEEPIPQVEYRDLQARIREIRDQLGEIDKKLAELAKVKPGLGEYKAKIEKQLELARVKAGMGNETRIAFLQGFCPAETIFDLKRLAEEDGWGYIIDDPDEPQYVPTLLKNPKPVRIIKPLFDFMGTLPGYNEMDISHVFLVFFSLFFAMIIGDAGYGLIFLLGTLFASVKIKNAPRTPFVLMYVLSGATILWGILTGTWFGSQTIARLPFVSPFIIDRISSFAENNQNTMMFLSFVIGAVHLSTAHLLAGLHRMKSITAIAELGWVAIIWGLFFIGQNLILGKPIPGYTVTMFIVGASIVALFDNFQKNILKGIGISLANLPLDVISGFSDVVSYLRLFAVGYATVVVASSFNSMAIGEGITSIVAGFGAAIILLLGHALNIILAMMSVLVHGVRLNMLEFSGHVGVQWSGKPYEPFKE